MAQLQVNPIYIKNSVKEQDVTNEMAVQVLDGYYLAITLLISVAYQLIGFGIAFTFKFDKLTDFMGGTNFVLLAILTLAFSAAGSSTVDARQIIASLFMMIWGARLSGFLLFRILKTGKDDRFDDKRDKFFPFLGFWVFQTFWVWSVSFPVTILNSPKVQRYRQPGLNACDGVGIAMWAIGMIFESISDVQKYRFRSNEGNKGRTCEIGLFSWSRHPNYFGEILLQFGIFTICISPSAYKYVKPGSGAYAAQYAAMLGPWFLTVLLLFVSGLTLQERPGAKKKFEADGPDGEKWRQYKSWTENTSILLPLPPGLWRKIPNLVKRTILFEWPIYVFDPERHADMGKVKARIQEEGHRRSPDEER